MADTRTDLYLNNWYHASQLGQGSPAFVETAFRELIKTDAQLKAEAGAKLASLTDKIVSRDYVSRIHRNFLQKVLNG